MLNAGKSKPWEVVVQSLLMAVLRKGIACIGDIAIK
jgi:hypothetical protein